MALLATLHDHRRAAERTPLDAEATLRVGGRPLDALIANISASGCLLICSEKLAIGDTMTIGIAGVGRREARIVRAEGQRCGAAFAAPLLRSEIDAVAAMPGDTIVSFPGTLPPSREDGSPFPTHPMSRLTRLAVIAALTAATWGVVVAALHLVG